MFANRQSRGRKQRSRGGGHTDLGRRPAGRSFWRRRRRDRRGGARPAGMSSSRRKETGGEQRRRRVLPGGEEARRRDLLPGEQRSRRDLLPGGGRGRGEYDFLSPSPPYPSPAQQRAAFFPRLELCARAHPWSHSFTRDGPHRPPSSIPRRLGLLGAAESPPSSA